MSSPARDQIRIAALVLGAMLGTIALLWGLAQNHALERAVRESELSAFARGGPLFLNRGNFREFEDRLLIDVLPDADYHRGGVYFIGSSNLKWALKLWELPPEQRALIHNYGIGGTNHRHQLQFVRFLVEDLGLLDAGAEKALVVLGISYRSAIEGGDYFPSLWRRHGVYAYDPERGPRMADLSVVERRLRLERARIASFVGVSINRVARAIAHTLGIPLSASFDLTDPAGIERVARRFFDPPNPEEQIADQVAALEVLVRYLRERGAGVSLAVVPEREFVHQCSIPRAYLAAVQRIAEQEGVPLLDLTQLLTENEFIDYNHANKAGLDKIHPLLLGLAEDFLVSRAER